MNSASAPVLLLFLFTLYMFPALVAAVRGVRRPAGLVVLNLFLGWTILGWVGALIWAAQAETADGKAGSMRQPMYQLGRYVRMVRGWIAGKA
jgi:Superinfection immunity protein